MSLQTPLHATDAEILELCGDVPTAKRAVRYGTDILMPSDRKIERWPSVARASERLDELDRRGYFVFQAPPGTAIAYADWMKCGPAEHCGVEHVRVGRTQEDPGEVVVVPYSDPDEEADL